MSEFFLIGTLILIFIIMTVNHKDQFLLGFVIVTLFTVTNDLSPLLRPFIHAADFLILFYLFIREYGFEFSRYPRVPKIIMYFFLLFYFSMIISSIFSNYPLLGFEKIIRTSVFFLIVYVFYGIIRTQKHVKTVFISLFITGLILVGGVVVDFILRGSNFFNELGSVRIRDFGLYSNFNTTAGYFIIIFPLLIIGLNYYKSVSKKIFIWIGIFYFLIGLLLIISRAAFIGAFIGSITVLFFLNRKALTKLVTILLVLVLLIIIIQPLTNFIDIAFRVDEGLSQRDHFWQLAFNIIQTHPLVGIGPGAYKYEEFNYFPVLFSSWMGQRMINLNEITGGNNNSHSYFFVFFSDMGIFGLTTAIALPLIFIKIAAATLRKYYHEEKIKLILIAIIASVISMFIRATIESIGIIAYGFLSNDLPFWLYFIVITKYYIDGIKKETGNEKKLLSG